MRPPGFRFVLVCQLAVLLLCPCLPGQSDDQQVLAPDTWNPSIVQSPEIYTETIALPDGRSIDKVTVPGRPPKNFKALAVAAPIANLSAGVNVLSNVPAFDWSYGCSATSAAMMMGYYDNTGYPNMYAGPTNGGVCPMTNSAWGSGECPLSATHNGYDNRAIYGHVDDYWRGYGNCDPDPFIGNWPEHVQGECTADYMGTNQSLHYECDGSTTFWYYTDGSPLYDYHGAEPTYRDGCHGMRLFVESRGYEVTTNYSQYIYGYNGNTKGFTFADFAAEIDAGRPVMIKVTGHSMVGYGYDANTSTIYIHDTWDHNDHQMTWGGSYSGLQHYGVAVVRPSGGIQVDAVSFSPDGGTYDSPQTVQITCATYGAVIHYTTTGLDPTEQDPIVTGSVLVDHDLTLKAKAWKVGLLPSAVKSAVYTLQVKTPVFSPDGGVYCLPQNVTIACATPDAVLHYTTDGDDPTESDPVVTDPVLVDRSMTLKAKAWKTDWTPSNVKSAYYGGIRLADLKNLPNDASVSVSRALVSAGWTSYFYIEADDRSCGIRVDKTSHGLSTGMRVDLAGLIKTNTSGERYISPTSATQSLPPGNTGATEPLVLVNREVGGGHLHYDPVTGAGQVGVKGATGLNNIGLLMTGWGRVTYSPTGYSYFVISDGSDVTDLSGYAGIRVSSGTMTKPTVGQHVIVTGAVGCFKSGTDYYPLLRPRTQADIVPVP